MTLLSTRIDSGKASLPNLVGAFILFLGQPRMIEEAAILNQRDLRGEFAFLIHELEKFDTRVRTEDHTVFQNDPKLVEDVKTLLQKMESIRNYFAYVS